MAAAPVAVEEAAALHDAALFEFVAAAEPRFAIAAQAPRWRATGPVAIPDIVAKREACLGALGAVEGVNSLL